MPSSVSGRFRRSFPPLPWTIACVLASSAVVAPLAVVLGSIFDGSGGAWPHVREHTLGEYAANTAALVAVVGLGTLAVGCTTAWVVTAYRFPGRGVLSWMLLLPIAVPGYIGAYMLTDLLQFSGPVQTTIRGWFGWQAGDYWFPPIRSLGGAAFVLVFSLYPYVYIAARIAFGSQSRSISEAARTLGVGPLARFARLSFPIARPAVIAGVMLVVMETLADYGTVDYFAIDTLATGVYRVWYGVGSQTAALQLSALLVSASAFVILIERRIHRSRSKRTDTARFSAPRPVALTGRRSAGALAICVLPVLIGFAIPLVQLIRLSASSGVAPLDARLRHAGFNSAGVGSVAACVAVLLALLLLFAARTWPGRLTRTLIGVSRLGYAIPGTVVAVALMGLLADLDHGLNAAWTSLRPDAGWAPGLLLSGSLFALLLGYQTRFLALPLGVIQGGYDRLPKNTDRAARTLGARPLPVLARVHLPALRFAVLSAGVLVFVDVIKELPVTLGMRPANFDTLAARAYRLASDERLAEAAGPSLVIVLVGVVPVWFIHTMLGSGLFSGRGPRPSEGTEA